jgi:hypothetical protein
MTTSPFSLSAPFSMSVAPGASGSFEVTNSGTKPLTVHESLARLSARSIQYPAADDATTTHMGAPWITVGPSSFTLAPGQSETVHISSRVPAGTQGNHFLEIVWTASPVQPAAGPLHLAGGIATTIAIPLAGTATAAGPPRVPAAQLAPHHGGLPAADLAGAGLGAAVALAAVAVAVRRRFHRRAA